MSEGRVRQELREAAAVFEGAARTPDRGAELCREHARAVDASLAGLFGAALERAGRQAGAVLVALGGYGREELAPHSDLDLLVAVRGWDTHETEELTRAVLYPLWDAGRTVGHRIRSTREVLSSVQETEEAMAWLDARYIAGDRPLFRDLEESVLARLRGARRGLYTALERRTEERHERYGHVGYLLEPQLRDGAGGLRDVHGLRWAGRLLGGREGLDALVDAGYLPDADRVRLEAAHAFLLALRAELHLAVGRKDDRLTLDRQQQVAEALGYADGAGSSAADVLMRDLYLRARRVAADTEGAWRRLLQPRSGRRRSRGGAEDLGDGCVRRGNQVDVVAATSPYWDPAGWLRAFRHMLRTGASVSPSSLAQLEGTLASGEPLPWTGAARSIFLELLASGRRSAPVLDAMDSCGFLSALIPEWSAIRCLPQRDPYHRYTVDVHLLRTVAELAETRMVRDADLVDAWSRVDDPAVLFVAALLHDIGKGLGGDHAAVGATLAGAAARRMGLLPESAREVEGLVAEHLTLPHLALHRDLSDPGTLAEARSRIPTTRRIAMLFLLARADAAATGAQASSPLRTTLLRALYTRLLDDVGATGRFRAAADTVFGGPEDVDVELGPDGFRTLVRRGSTLDELVCVARDRRGLLAAVSGVLALRGVEVHHASTWTRGDGVAVEHLYVSGTHGPIPAERWERIRADIGDVLAGELDVDDALRKKASRPTVPRVPGSEPEILIDNAASARYTLVEVRADDRIGLLRALATTLTAHGCDIRIAKVATYGMRAVDVFYVVGAGGVRVEGVAAERLERALRGALARRPRAAGTR